MFIGCVGRVLVGCISRCSLVHPYLPTNLRQCRSFFRVRESPTTISPLQVNTKGEEGRGEKGGEGGRGREGEGMGGKERLARGI